MKKLIMAFISLVSLSSFARETILEGRTLEALMADFKQIEKNEIVKYGEVSDDVKANLIKNIFADSTNKAKTVVVSGICKKENDSIKNLICKVEVGENTENSIGDGFDSTYYLNYIVVEDSGIVLADTL